MSYCRAFFIVTHLFLVNFAFSFIDILIRVAVREAIHHPSLRLLFVPLALD